MSRSWKGAWSVAETARILVVDDEPQIVRALGINLKALGYRVVTAASGEEALRKAAEHRPDTIILDLGLPGIDGIDVIRGIRGWSTVPIIVLSVRDAEREKIAALDAGADDYVTKPFGMGELLARLRAALRRESGSDDALPLVVTEHFTIDLSTKRVTGPTEGEIRLTPTEWGIVEMLVRHRGKLVTQTQLLKEVWGPQYGEETNYLRVFMAQLRRKLEPQPSAPRYFITEPGMGYRFEAPDQAPAID
jgi:two-component system KDP operon response regulator KdpE